MATDNTACYYGLHFGCVNATNPDCKVCAERLTHAVNQVVGPETTSNAGVHVHRSE